MTDQRRYAPATARNREPILAVLTRVLPAKGLVLEIASGTGEHAVHFASHLPALTFQPTDPTDDALISIEAWRAEAALPNLRAPSRLDAGAAGWPVDSAEAMICINMIHIAPWRAAEGLFAGAGRVLAKDAPLYLYGPYKRGGEHMGQGNVDFDAWLKGLDPAYGVRDLEAVATLAAGNGFGAPEVIEMPANNLSVIFRKL